MPLTWAQARTKVRGDLWRSASGISDDWCNRAIHDALLELEAERRWLWLEGISTSNTFADPASEFVAPDDCRSVTSLQLLRLGGNAIDTLAALPLGRIRFLQQNSILTGGTPCAYALSDGVLYFDSEIPAGYRLEMVYTARTPPDLDVAVAAASNVTLNLHQSTVIGLACSYASIFLKNDEGERRFRRAYEARLNRLIEVEDEARGDIYGGSIVPDSDYQALAGSN